MSILRYRDPVDGKIKEMACMKEDGGGGSYDEGYSAGYDAGMGEGIEVGRANGIEDGKQEAYDTFWDEYQDGGNRTNYSASFGACWNETNFKPKYDLNVSFGPYMFAYSPITDLVTLLERQGVSLDFSMCTANAALNNAFYESKITRLGVVDLSGQGNCNYVFYRARDLVRIDKVIFRSTNVNDNLHTTFTDCTSLTDVVIEGVIRRNISFRWCPLSRASIESVMTALSDTETGQTATFKKSAVDSAFETVGGAADGSTSEEWKDLVASKPNWSIVLAE